MKKLFQFIGILVIGIVIGGVIGNLLTTKLKNKEIESLKNTISDNDNEIQSLKDKYAAKEQDIASKEQDIASKENEVTELRKGLSYASLPDLPIKVSVRKALTSDTLVLQLTNFSNNTIRTQISWLVEGTNQNRIIELYPNQLKELGHRQGYPFKSGDVISISTNGYKVKNLRMQ